MNELIKVEIEMDQHGFGNWQWFVKRVPNEVRNEVNEHQAVREYFKPYGYEVRGVKFL